MRTSRISPLRASLHRCNRTQKTRDSHAPVRTANVADLDRVTPALVQVLVQALVHGSGAPENFATEEDYYFSLQDYNVGTERRIR